jgi:hypothetical protein
MFSYKNTIRLDRLITMNLIFLLPERTMLAGSCNDCYPTFFVVVYALA